MIKQSTRRRLALIALLATVFSFSLVAEAASPPSNELTFTVSTSSSQTLADVERTLQDFGDFTVETKGNTLKAVPVTKIKKQRAIYVITVEPTNLGTKVAISALAQSGVSPDIPSLGAKLRGSTRISPNLVDVCETRTSPGTPTTTTQ